MDEQKKSRLTVQEQFLVLAVVTLNSGSNTVFISCRLASFFVGTCVFGQRLATCQTVSSKLLWEWEIFGLGEGVVLPSCQDLERQEKQLQLFIAHVLPDSQLTGENLGEQRPQPQDSSSSSSSCTAGSYNDYLSDSISDSDSSWQFIWASADSAVMKTAKP